MKVLQIIDTLRPGGAERMAVSYANALVERVERSYLCCTREEGLLQRSISPEVGYIFLGKTSTIDLRAFWRLRKFVRQNKIDLIQAHSSSWFLGLVIKLSSGRVNLVWHDHFGRELKFRKAGLLKPASKYFNGIISVNEGLRKWSMANLKTSKVAFYPNFIPVPNKTFSSKNIMTIQGDPDSFRVLCVANMRPQKDHLNLLKSLKLVIQRSDLVSLHLVGKDENNDYSEQIKKIIEEEDILKEKVFFYGEQEDVISIMKQCDLGILSSSSEGLPVALLEYGCAGLPVVVTDVGQCAGVVAGNGRICPAADPVALAAEILFYFENPRARIKDATDFHKRVQKNYSEEVVLEKVLHFFNET